MWIVRSTGTSRIIASRRRKIAPLSTSRVWHMPAMIEASQASPSSSNAVPSGL